MQDMITLIVGNLEKVGIGALIFLILYFSNMGVGAWRSVHIEGYDFDWQLIKQSIIKYLVMALSIAGITIGITSIPAYAVYVGVPIPEEYIETINVVVIYGAFITASCKYAQDGIIKLKEMFGIGNVNK